MMAVKLVTIKNLMAKIILFLMINHGKVSLYRFVCR
jgi:hypothetical protein